MRCCRKPGNQETRKPNVVLRSPQLVTSTDRTQNTCNVQHGNCRSKPNIGGSMVGLFQANSIFCWFCRFVQCRSDVRWCWWSIKNRLLLAPIMTASASGCWFTIEPSAQLLRKRDCVFEGNRVQKIQFEVMQTVASTPCSHWSHRSSDMSISGSQWFWCWDFRCGENGSSPWGSS